MSVDYLRGEVGSIAAVPGVALDLADAVEADTMHEGVSAERVDFLRKMAASRSECAAAAALELARLGL